MEIEDGSNAEELLSRISTYSEAIERLQCVGRTMRKVEVIEFIQDGVAEIIPEVLCTLDPDRVIVVLFIPSRSPTSNRSKPQVEYPLVGPTTRALRGSSMAQEWFSAKRAARRKVSLFFNLPKGPSGEASHSKNVAAVKLDGRLSSIAPERRILADVAFMVLEIGGFWEGATGDELRYNR
ncbi:MAG: hypothetical protein Q9221_003972 [Calogaya cf. arnoldii]